MKTRSILVVSLVAMGFTPVQANYRGRQLAEVLFGYVANKLLARGEKKEFPNSQALINVRIIEPDGSEKMGPGWDTSIPTSVAFDAPSGGDVILEPSLYNNSSGSPHELRFYLDDRLIDIRHFHGGRREGLKVDDNLGMVDDATGKVKPFQISLKTISWGWHFGKIAAGNTVATFKFQKINYASLLTLMNDEGARRVLLGYGQSAYPSLPVLGASVNGKVVTAATPQEMDEKIAQINQNEPVRRVDQGKIPVANKPEPTSPDDGPTFHMYGMPYTPSAECPATVMLSNEVVERLTQRVLGLGDLDIANPIPVQESQNFFLLLRGPVKFHFVAKSNTGKVLVDKKAVKVGESYQVRVRLLFCDGIKGTALYVNDQLVDKFTSENGGSR